MSVLITIGLAVAGAVTLLLLVAALPPRKRNNLTKEEVAIEIEAFLSGTGGAVDWDEFCTFTLADPKLDKIRARCAGLDQEFPPGLSGGYCNEKGMEVLREYVEQLRVGAACTSRP
jgi:hypothetical protein